MANKIQLRRDTAANWTTANPVLGQGEPGAEIDTGRLKIGDGVKDWKTLPDISDSHLQFTQAGAGAKPRGLTAKLQDMVSVKDFGAVGDGNADDTVAIQAAIDSGKAAFVPKGTYKISATLNLNDGYKALIGDESMPIITKTNAGPAIRIGVTSGTAGLNERSSVQNLFLKSTTVTPTFPIAPSQNDAAVVLNGSDSSTAAAVQAARVCNVRVGGWSCGFFLRDTVGCTIEQCTVQLLKSQAAATGFTADNKFCGFLLNCTPHTPGGISPQASLELVEIDVVAEGTPTAVTSIGYYVIGPDIRDIFFDRCEATATTYGWYVLTTTSDYNWDIHIRRPIVDAYRRHGIYVEGANGLGAITVSGGYFIGRSTANACIFVKNSSGVTVTGGAQVRGPGNDTALDDGVHFDTCNSCSVVGNNFVNLNFGVSLYKSNNCTVVGNSFSAAATATEAHPALSEAIRVNDGSEENTIVGNAINGKDATDRYDRGIAVAAGCLRNVVLGNSIDSTSVATAYSIADSSTTLLSANATTISSTSIWLKSNSAKLQLQGSDAATPVEFLDGAGAVASWVRADGGYRSRTRLTLQGSDATYPVVFLDGAGNPIAKINNAGVYSPGAP